MGHALRDAVRALRHAPGFTCCAILALGLGLGANTTLFSVVNGVLLRPFPFPASERLVVLTRDGGREADVSPPDAVDLRAGVPALAAVGFHWPGWAVDLTGEGDPLRLQASVAEPEFFTAMALPPAQGRVFSGSDGDARLAVLSDGLWRSRFGARPDILGRVISLNGNPYSVVGVMPPAFGTFDPTAQLWVPVAAETPWALAQRGSNGFEAVARLAPGATVAEATSQLHALTTDLARRYPDTNGSKILAAVPFRTFFGAPARGTLLALWAAVALLALITGVNLASLMLARGVSRQGQMAVRLALGARGRDLLRAVLLESLLLALGGCALGLLLSTWGVGLVQQLAGTSLPRGQEIGVDGAAVLWSLLLAALLSFLVGAVPAWRARRTAPAESLGALRSGPGAGTHRVLGAAIVVESAVALVLLVGCLLLSRTFERLSRVNLGFVPDQVLSTNLVLPELRYGDRERQSLAFSRILAEVQALPGVVSAATVISPPLGGGGVGHTVVIEGAPAPARGHEPGASSRPVLGDYFETLRIPIVQGRKFTAQDDGRAAPVAIVNQEFARRHWPGQEAVGRRLAFHGIADSLRWMTVVGVALDVRTNGPASGDDPAVYTPYLQREVGWQRFGTLMVRTTAEPASMTAALQRAVWSVDPALPLETIHPLPAMLSGVLGRERLSAVISLTLAGAALLITAQGIFGVLSFLAGVRRREIALRLALGAEPGRIAWMMTGQGLRLAGAGLLAGLVVALGASRLIAALLFGVGPSDGPSYLLAALLLLTVALVASWLPAWRAARSDPATVLKAE